MLFVLLIAGSPNSSPEQIVRLKWMMGACVVGGLICCGAGIMLLVRAHPVWGGAIGALPLAVMFGLIVWVGVSS